MARITKERWTEAQIAERKFHNKPKEQALIEYQDAYRQYFEWLGMDFDLQGKSIIEIGPADIPALYFCDGYRHSWIIEPMPSSILEELVAEKGGITIYKTCAEYDVIDWEWDEVWLFNVLQHVLDPDKVIENAKKWAKTIRFFEPVDQPISDCHPHAPTLEDFKRWFGDSVNYYGENPTAKNFHTATCAYGTWTGNT